MVRGGEFIGTSLPGLPNIGKKVKENAYKKFKRSEVAMACFI
jgi:hypothetical protein